MTPPQPLLRVPSSLLRLGLAVLLAACGDDASALDTDASTGDAALPDLDAATGSDLGADDAGITASERYLDVVFDEVEVTEGIPFGESVPFGEDAPTPLLLDLFTPDGDDATGRPVIVWIHGGGFIIGSRTEPGLVQWARDYAQRGYVTASISYRLRSRNDFNEDPFGAITDAVQDAAAAVRYFEENAEALGVDPDRIAVGGTSAGATTALFLSYFASSAGMPGSPPGMSNVRAVIDYWGSLPGPDTDDFIESGEAPLMIVHGTEDTTVLFTEAEELAARAEDVGLTYEFLPLEGAGHSAYPVARERDPEVVAFLYEHVAR
ncbi:MAG: alpha/beta hydrolase [Myxococcota bacterium]